MYSPLHKKTGVTVVADWVSQFQSPDGLTFAPPGGKLPFSNLAIPERLYSWFLDLRLLRPVPLCYLVPDPSLLPTESIRFFHVDPTWIDRVIDGVFAAGNTGTVDATFTYPVLQAIRNELDSGLEQLAQASLAQAAAAALPDPPKDFTAGATWRAASGQITGLLIRSELTRRWPDMIVEGFSDLGGTTLVAPLRREPVSRDIYIALFAGEPRRVDIREPHVGMRFGVEGVASLTVPVRTPDGSRPNKHPVPVTLRDRRVLDVAGLPSAITSAVADAKLPSFQVGPRMIALHLERLAKAQTFRTDRQTPEASGSRSPLELMVGGALPIIPMGGGRTLDLRKLAARLTKL